MLSQFAFVCYIIIAYWNNNCISFPHANTNFCVNCKYFIQYNDLSYDDDTKNEYGKCTLFPRFNIDNTYLITGKKIEQDIDYNYCSVARTCEHMCGEQGKKYIIK